MKTYIKSSEETRYYILCIENDLSDRKNPIRKNPIRRFYLWRGNRYAREWTPYKEECETFTKEEARKIISELERKYGTRYSPTAQFVRGYFLEEVKEPTE